MKRAVVTAFLCFWSWTGGLAEPAQAPAKARQSAVKQPGARSAPQNEDGLKSIAIVSQFGDTFTVQHVGVLAFGNERRELSIESWGVDRLATVKAASILKRRYNVEPLVLTEEVRMELKEAPSGLWGDRDDYLCKTLHRLTPDRRHDYYLWISGSSTPVTYNSNQSIQGLGALRLETVSGPETRVHAIFTIEALDGRTCATTRRQFAAYSDDGGEALLKGMNWAGAKVDEGWFSDAAQGKLNNGLKGAVIDLMERLLTNGLKRMFGGP